MAFKSDLEALILGVLQESPAHGYEIARRVKKLSANALELGENRLYPSLKTLEDDGSVEAVWEPQDGRPPRKVYRLTADGRRVLDSKLSSWVKFSDAVNQILVPGVAKEAANGKYLDWYLVELEKGLDQRMGPQAAFELINQTEDHILMIKEELMVAGMEESRAEQAAIQRFGELDTLASKPKEAPIVRANWASPVLVIVGGAAIAGASMIVGSAESMIIAGSLWVASLIVSAVLCCRKGRFPGLAFGILFAVCFAALSCIASYEFFGQRLDFVKRTDRAQYAVALVAAQQSVDHSRHLLRLGEAWAGGHLGRRVPVELRDSAGILSPVKPFYMTYFATAPELGPNSQIMRLFGFPGRIQTLTHITTLEPLRHAADAAERWRQFKNDEYGRNAFVDQRYESYRPSSPKEALALLQASGSYDTDNLFAGALIGTLVTCLWMLIACTLNKIASIELDPVSEPIRLRRRIAR